MNSLYIFVNIFFRSRLTLYKCVFSAFNQRSERIQNWTFAKFCPRENGKRNFIVILRPTVNTSSSRKQELQCEWKFEIGKFRKQWRHDNQEISVLEFSSNPNPRSSAIAVLSHFSVVEWTEAFLITEIFEINDVKIIKRFLFSSFP